jgi:hypothetical protein
VKWDFNEERFDGEVNETGVQEGIQEPVGVVGGA